MRGSRFLVAVGVVAVLAGTAALLQPSLARRVGLSPGQAVVTVLALLALVQGVLAVVRRIRGERRAAALPEVERRERAAVPGDEFDEALASLPQRGPDQRDRIRAEVRARLESAALGTLTRRGLQEDRARRHLREGTWTPDDIAAEFFLPPAEREVTLGARIRSAIGAERVFRRRAVRTVEAIAAHAEGEAPLPERRDGDAAPESAGGATARAAADGGRTAAPDDGRAGTRGGGHDRGERR